MALRCSFLKTARWILLYFCTRNPRRCSFGGKGFRSIVVTFGPSSVAPAPSLDQERVVKAESMYLAHGMLVVAFHTEGCIFLGLAICGRTNLMLECENRVTAGRFYGRKARRAWNTGLDDY